MLGTLIMQDIKDETCTRLSVSSKTIHMQPVMDSKPFARISNTSIVAIFTYVGMYIVSGYFNKPIPKRLQ
jgi:hypothetical protein